MHAYYVLIEEKGEYSGASYTVLGVFDDLKAVRIERAALQYEIKKREELAEIVPRWTERAEYVIERACMNSVEVHEPLYEFHYLPERSPEVLDDPIYLAKKAEIDAKLSLDFVQARKEREAFEAQRAEAQKKRHEEQEQAVREFLDWWDAGFEGDPYFLEKRAARVRHMKHDVEEVALRTNDPRAIQWTLLERNKL